MQLKVTIGRCLAKVVWHILWSIQATVCLSAVLAAGAVLAGGIVVCTYTACNAKPMTVAGVATARYGPTR